jgi:hypothetical protein
MTALMIAIKGNKKTAIIKEKEQSRTRYCIKKQVLVFIGIYLLAGRIIGNAILSVKRNYDSISVGLCIQTAQRMEGPSSGTGGAPELRNIKWRNSNVTCGTSSWEQVKKQMLQQAQYEIKIGDYNLSLNNFNQANNKNLI